MQTPSPLTEPAVPVSGPSQPAQAAILAALDTVIDPELGLSILELGLVYRVDVTEDGRVLVVFTATSPACPLADVLGNGILRAVSGVLGVQGVRAELVREPVWTPSLMTPAAMAKLSGRRLGRVDAEEDW